MEYFEKLQKFTELKQLFFKKVVFLEEENYENVLQLIAEILEI